MEAEDMTKPLFYADACLKSHKAREAAIDGRRVLLTETISLVHPVNAGVPS
jgi:hypothetical protein